MSGPKTSRYTLTPEQRRILAEQRKIERRKAVASEQIKRDTKRLREFLAMHTKEKQIASELTARDGQDGGFSAKVNELEQLIGKTLPIATQLDANSVDSLEQGAKAIADCVAVAEKTAEDLAVISAENESKLRSDLLNAIDEGFNTSFADITVTEQKNEDAVKQSALSRIILMKASPSLSPQLKEELAEVITRIEKITDAGFIKNYIAVTVTPLIKKCEEYISNYEQHHAEFESLYSEYLALCEMYYYVAQEYPCSLESIEQLKIEIARISEEAAADEEEEYIARCLDEVMEEMGYTVLGSREVKKKNGKHFRHELYTYGEGTAVDITYSSDGKIAMELGGVDTADRTPTHEESVKLCEDMESFCEDFKEIEKRLLAKGVVLADRISLLPPSQDYAQIINTSDYEMETEAKKLEVKRQRRAAAKLKAMKKE